MTIRILLSSDDVRKLDLATGSLANLINPNCLEVGPTIPGEPATHTRTLWVYNELDDKLVKKLAHTDVTAGLSIKILSEE